MLVGDSTKLVWNKKIITKNFAVKIFSDFSSSLHIFEVLMSGY